MNSNRRTVGWSLGFVAIVFLTTWFTWDRWPGGALPPMQIPSRSEAHAAEEHEQSPATGDSPEQATDADQVGSATPQVDFSGQWQLNVEASDSLDEIMKAIGVSFIQRGLVNNTVITHTIQQTADELTIEVKTTFFSRTDRLPLHGEPAQTTDPSGRPVESTSAWSDDGRQLITKIWVPRDQQRFTMTRSLDEGQDAMEVWIEFFPKAGKSLTSRRVYRRVEVAATGKSS
jgi:hypothetical protein